MGRRLHRPPHHCRRSGGFQDRRLMDGNWLILVFFALICLGLMLAIDGLE